MRGDRRSLRFLLSATTVLVVLLALLSSGALIALTTVIHRSVVGAAAAVESVRLAEEAEVDLLLHARSSDPVVRTAIESDLLRRLNATRRFVTTEHEARIIGEAKRRVDEYLAGSTLPGSSESLETLQGNAYRALEALVTVNVQQAREAQGNAAWGDRLGNFIGIGSSAWLLVIAGGLVVWLRRRAFAPVLSLAAVMERFGAGDRQARAEEGGPTELREMSRRFNEMASVLAAERSSQMAFLAGVAHDLRNPLSVLSLSLDAVPPGQPLPPEESIRQLFARFGRQIDCLDRMVGDLLDVTRIEAGELELRPEMHDVRILVREVVDFFNGMSASNRIAVILPSEPAPTVCDRLRIGQVLANLISNAIKYATPPGLIEVAVEPHGDEVFLRVSDQGPGMSQDEQKRLFEPFRRSGLSKDTVPGAGLGLFVAKRIMDSHGGRIELESTPGAGSTFLAILPVRRATRLPGTKEGGLPPETMSAPN